MAQAGTTDLNHTSDDKARISSRISEGHQHQPPAQYPLSTICPVCHSLFYRPNYQEEWAFVSHDEDSFAASSEKCLICITIKSRNLTALKAPKLALRHHLKGDVSTWSLWSEQIMSDGSIDKCYTMELFPSLTISGTPMIETDPCVHNLDRSSVAITPQLMVESTAGDACFDLIKRCQRECMEEHTLCREERVNNLKFQLPTRLIDVRMEPRLVAGSALQSSNSVQYATVSHRWQEGSSAKLLRSNIDNLMKAIDFTALPQLFQDSITAARRLGIDFVWIDALCIVQDDADDWRLESSRMGSVYQNAVVNLGASGGPIPRSRGAFNDDSSHPPAPVGLFMSRRASDYLIPHINITRQGFSRNYFCFTRKIQPQSHEQVPLLRRGWVFQERLLSPKSVYFGEQLTWECPELLANESFPEGSPGFSSLWINNGPSRLSRILKRPKFETLEYANGVVINDLYRTWFDLVAGYSHCNLTFQSDALPAISGLAHGFSKKLPLSDVWMYGLFRMDLIRGLLWHRCVGHCAKLDAHPPTQRDSKYTLEHARRQSSLVPSWSWAAADLPVDFPHITDVRGSEFEVFLATADFVSSKPDLTSSRMSGLIRIVGSLRPNLNTTVRALIADHIKIIEGDHMEFYDWDWEHDDHDMPVYQGTYLLMLTYRPAKATKVGKDRVRGLILKPTGRVSDEYRRVGVFALDPTLREEFAGLDFTDLDKQVITLV